MFFVEMLPLSIEATCDEEVPVAPNKTFFLLSYVIVLLHCPVNSTVFLKFKVQYPFLKC